MHEIFVPRASEYTLELTRLPGAQLDEGGPIDLYYGKHEPVALDLNARHFRVLYLLGAAAVEDEANGLPERFRGYRTTASIARAYADQVHNLIAPGHDAIYAYIKTIRAATDRAAIQLADQLEIAIPTLLNPIAQTRGRGYRIGNLSLRILDYRPDSARV